jgi:hypothetical protein
MCAGWLVACLLCLLIESECCPSLLSDSRSAVVVCARVGLHCECVVNVECVCADAVNSGQAKLCVFMRDYTVASLAALKWSPRLKRDHKALKQPVQS